MTLPRRSLRTAAAVALSLALACGKSDPIGPRTPTQLSVQAGDHQSGPVGAALAVKIKVSARDAQGGVPDVVIQASATGTNGILAPTVATTNATGDAEFTWTLGVATGNQTVTFSVGTTLTTTATATGTPGTAVAVIPVTDQLQLTVVGHAVAVLPAVKVTDAFGNGIAGVPVTFDTPVAGSVITGTERTSDASGLATLGSWTIGPEALFYNARARIATGAAAVFEARGIPSTFTLVAGGGQTGNIGTALPILPAVKAVRDDGSPLANVAVSFVVTAGAGQVLGPGATTGVDGIARPGSWILSTTPGTNGLDARTTGRDPVAFSATGVLAVPASIAAASPTSQTAFFGNYVKSQPTVLVKDANGDPVFGATVTFQLTQGDGTVNGTTGTTGPLGTASLGGWKVGTAPIHKVHATVDPLGGLDFTTTAGAVPPSTFKIDVRFLSSTTPAQQAAFDQAAARWTEILVSGDAPYPVNEPPGACTALMPAMNETVDGVVIFANLRSIDGVGQILGQAGPCIVRDDPGYLTAVGIMEFDTADLAGLESSGRLNQVILHEMAHVLGFGTIWNFLSNNFLSGPGSAEPFFTGSSARGAFLGSSTTGTFPGNSVPVEGSGGAGTRDAHWRETTVSNELMTGFLNTGVNPLSAFSAASFRDVGYTVNDAATDPFFFAPQVQAAPGAWPSISAGLYPLNEAPITAPIIVIDRQGRHVARLPRK